MRVSEGTMILLIITGDDAHRKGTPGEHSRVHQRHTRDTPETYQRHTGRVHRKCTPRGQIRDTPEAHL